MRLAFCTAWPAAPLPRLSSALTTTARPAVGVDGDLQVARCCCPSVAAVCGQLPSGSTCTNGSSAYAACSAARSSPRWRPRPAGRCTVARMPRGIGASTGVNDSVTSRRLPPSALLDLRRVLVTPPTLYGDRSPITSLPSRCGLGRAAGARGAGGGDHDDVGRLDQAGGEQRRERQRHRGRRSSPGSATRRRAGERGPGAGQLGQAVGPAAGVRRRRSSAARRPASASRWSAPRSTTCSVGGQLPRPARPTGRAAAPGRPGRRRPARPARSAAKRRCRRAAAAAGAASVTGRPGRRAGRDRADSTARGGPAAGAAARRPRSRWLPPPPPSVPPA